jgi:RNA-directed DNA polymerase
LTFWEWLKSLWTGWFKPRPLVRDVSRVGREGDDAVQEVVTPEGGPWKPGSTRKVVHDKRLLPKAKRKIWSQKPPKVMDESEADRLFAGTLRTKNREIRTLAADVDQLRRYGLPEWKTEAELAAALGVSVRLLRWFAMHREMERTPHYVAFTIPKRSGGERLIVAPKRRLKALQRKLNELLVQKLPVSEHAHGFVTGRSIRTGAEPHVGKKVVVHADLADFFHQVTYQRVRGYLIGMGYGYAVAATIAAVCTESPRQPVHVEGTVFHVPVGPRRCVQGAPTSPGLCNAIAHRMDRRLAGHARKLGFAYTRYADDLAFSGEGDFGKLLGGLRRVCEAEGFPLNEAKTRVMRSGRRQQVTGVTVNAVLGLSRKERRRIRAALHQGAAGPRIEGKLAYVGMLNEAQAEQLRKAPKK